MWRAGGTERADDRVPPWTQLEHDARYRFASGQILDGSVVLDCACGDGSGAAHYLRAGPRALFGLDYDAGAVEQARREVTDERARFAVADATALPQPDASVDLYISLETIEHVPDAHALLSEAARVLKPDGRLICSTPNRAIQNPGASLEDDPICTFHVREYTPRDLLDLLRQYFDTVEFYGQNDVGRLRRQYLRVVGRLPSRHLAARLGQAAKLTRLLVDSPERHAVVPVQRGHSYDLTVAVCSDPHPRPKPTG
jgi:SAM-dependent methyltransferase